MRNQAGDRLRQIAVESIAPSPYQPRREFTDASLMALADSIRRYGLISPIAVRETGDGFELIAGERRLRAVKLLGQGHIDALVMPAEDREVALMALAENIQREQLNLFEQADAFRRMLDEHRFTQEELARRLSISQSAVANKLRLNKLSGAVREAILKGELTERHARALLKLGAPKDQLEAAEKAAREKMSVKQLETLVERLCKPPEPRKAGYRLYLRDQRVLVNAVLNTVKSLNAAGVKATSRIEEREDAIEVVVTLPYSQTVRSAQ